MDDRPAIGPTTTQARTLPAQSPRGPLLCDLGNDAEGDSRARGSSARPCATFAHEGQLVGRFGVPSSPRELGDQYTGLSSGRRAHKRTGPALSAQRHTTTADGGFGSPNVRALCLVLEGPGAVVDGVWNETSRGQHGRGIPRQRAVEPSSPAIRQGAAARVVHGQPPLDYA